MSKRKLLNPAESINPYKNRLTVLPSDVVVSAAADGKPVIEVEFEHSPSHDLMPNEFLVLLSPASAYQISHDLRKAVKNYLNYTPEPEL